MLRCPIHSVGTITVLAGEWQCVNAVADVAGDVIQFKNYNIIAVSNGRNVNLNRSLL